MRLAPSGNGAIDIEFTLYNGLDSLKIAIEFESVNNNADRGSLNLILKCIALYTQDIS